MEIMLSRRELNKIVKSPAGVAIGNRKKSQVQLSRRNADPLDEETLGVYFSGDDKISYCCVPNDIPTFHEAELSGC